MPDQRQVHLAYLIINRARIFRDSLKDWNKEDERNKTFDNMKIFMREQYDELEAVNALSIDETMNHTEIIDELKLHQEHLSARLESQFKVNLVETLDAYSRTSTNGSQSGDYSSCPPAKNSSGSMSNISQDSVVMMLLQK